MADIKFEVDFKDLKLLNDELNKTTKAVEFSANKASQDFLKLKRSIDPVYAATETFKEKVLIAQKAVATGAITNAEYAKTMDQISKQAQRAGVTLDKFGQVTAMSGKSMRHFELGVQQAGYQVGDFFVQVASGTNPMVAFSQQASQLAGFFAGPWGAAIGAGIAIFGALYVAFDRMGEKAGQTQKELAESIATARIELEELKTGMDSTERGLLANLEMERKKARELAAAHELRRQSLISVGEDADFYSRQELAAYHDQMVVVRQYIADLEEYRQIVADINKETEKQAEQESFRERLASLKEENDLLRIRREYGENSIAEADYLVLLKQKELNSLRDAGLLTQDQVDAEMALVREQRQLNDQLDAAKVKGEAFADALERAASAMSSLTSLGDTLDRALSVSEAKVSALSAGANAAVAGQIAGYEFDIRRRTDEAVAAATAAGQSPYAAIQAGQAQMDTLSKLKASEEARVAAEEAARGGGGGSKTKTTPYIEQLLAEADYKRKIVGLSDQEVRRREIMFELSKREEVASEAQIEQIIKLEEETRKLTEAQTQAERQQKAFTDILMDGMESLVTGSKSVEDAFKDTIRNILLDVYRQKVLQPLATAGSDFLLNMFKADGGAFNRGVQMYADGGVVSSPTMFGHSGGLGLMGEAGPEAIMPLKRGANGKLGVQMEGGSGAISVVNNITVNGNDNPAAVRAELAKLMPQIEKATVNSVINARKRGGQMKAAFR